jgi:predicted nucleic acid-binding protein
LIVIDASATVALLLNEDRAVENSAPFFALVDEPLMAPSHWPAEVGNALVTNLRRGRLNADQLGEMAGQLERLEIRIDAPPTIETIATIARRAHEWALTYYDAAYIYGAQLHDASLFTFDEQMRSIAARLNIPLLPA